MEERTEARTGGLATEATSSSAAYVSEYEGVASWCDEAGAPPATPTDSLCDATPPGPTDFLCDMGFSWTTTRWGSVCCIACAVFFLFASFCVQLL